MLLESMLKWNFCERVSMNESVGIYTIKNKSLPLQKIGNG